MRHLPVQHRRQPRSSRIVEAVEDVAGAEVPMDEGDPFGRIRRVVGEPLRGPGEDGGLGPESLRQLVRPLGRLAGGDVDGIGTGADDLVTDLSGVDASEQVRQLVGELGRRAR